MSFKHKHEILIFLYLELLCNWHTLLYGETLGKVSSKGNLLNTENGQVAGRGLNLARQGENQGGYWIGNLLYCAAGLNVTHFVNASRGPKQIALLRLPRSDSEGLVHRQEVLVWLLKS